MKCVSAFNPGSTSLLQNVTFDNIPINLGVIYLAVSFDARLNEGTFITEKIYDLTTLETTAGNLSIIFINEEGTITNIGGWGQGSWKLDGKTLKSTHSTRYGNYGLFVLE